MEEWTPEEVLRLEREADDHIDNCDECQIRLLAPPPVDTDEQYLCDVAEVLLDKAGDASLEYSCQENFDPDWMNKSEV